MKVFLLFERRNIQNCQNIRECSRVECEECDTKQNGYINLNDHMSWTHEDYYDFYGFLSLPREKVTRLRSLLHENHKYVIGMIGIAAFFAME